MKNILFIIALAGILLSAQLGFGALINLSAPPAGEIQGGTSAVENEVKKEGDKLASNAGLVNTNLELLVRIAEESKISLNIVVPENVQNPVGYALTLAMIGGVKITAVGTAENPAYTVEESSISPKIFAATQVIKNPSIFAQAIDKLEGNQIGVVLSGNAAERAAVEKLPEFQERQRAGKVVLPPVALVSNVLLTALLEEANKNQTGISLNNALLSPAVMAAMQGAV